MRRILLALALVFLAGAQSLAEFQDGLLAYHRGDHVRAYEIWRPLAEAGDPEAQYSLGLLYQRGEGVLPDLKAAASWYLRAAEQGDPDAQLNLGLLYARGEGVRQSDVEAYKWFTLAYRAYPAGESREAALRNRESIAGIMSEPQIAKAERLAERWRSKPR